MSTATTRASETARTRPPTRREAAAQAMVDGLDANVRDALALIEDAQNTLEAACQKLCPVPGFAREWDRVGNLRDKVKEHWYEVEGAFQRAMNDSRIRRGEVANG